MDLIMITRTIHLGDGDTVLHFPIADTEALFYVRIIASLDGEVTEEIGEFRIGLTGGRADFYCPFDVKRYHANEITFIAEEDNAPADLFDGILAGGSPDKHPELYPDPYREKYRQQLHFSPFRGWMNDPNGLVYRDGRFHMCFQHNPFGQNHGGVNVSWGMAVSEDGVHFREYPDAIMPHTPRTHIASGSAIVDAHNVSGFGAGTVLAVYTALASASFSGRPANITEGQILNYSLDGGYSFHPFPDQPIIPVPVGEYWRDPKIFETDAGVLCIAVYETWEGKNCVSFYRSTDCRNWEFVSRTMDLYECPDLFRLNVRETGEKLWILYGANGMYRIGRFENFAFTQTVESMYIDYGDVVYAGQTWNCTPGEDERYYTAWIRDGQFAWDYDPNAVNGVGFAQSMAAASVFTLHRTSKGYRLFRAPVEALKTLRKEATKKTVCSPAAVCGPTEFEFFFDTDRDLSVNVNGQGFSYDAGSRELRFTSGKSCILTTTEKNASVRVLLDTRSAEFYIAGEVTATYAVYEEKKTLTLTPAFPVTAWEMESIWPHP